MNIEETLLDIQNMAKRSLEKIAALRGMEANLSRISAGVLPKRLQSNLATLKDVDEVLKEDDEWFIKQLASVADTRDVVQSMMNLATLAARLDEAGRRLDGRIAKLADRISKSGSAEAQTAIALKTNLIETRKVIDARLGTALERFFEARLYAINATLKLTEKICGLWKDGSTGLRTAALKSSAAQAIDSLAEWERVAIRGQFKIGNESGKGSVRI